jgi:hypothetical protein
MVEMHDTTKKFQYATQSYIVKKVLCVYGFIYLIDLLAKWFTNVEYNNFHLELMLIV